MPIWYVLDQQRRAVPASILEASQQLENLDSRVVAQHQVGEVVISTVFLTINHNFGREGPPLVFETLVDGGDYDGHQDRYSTWEEAEEGHWRVVKMVEGSNHDAYRQAPRLIREARPASLAKAWYARLLEEDD